MAAARKFLKLHSIQFKIHLVIVWGSILANVFKLVILLAGLFDNNLLNWVSEKQSKVASEL